MGIIAVTVIFVCICVDNMVSANMSSMKIASDKRSVFSIKMALFFTLFNMLFYGIGFLVGRLFFHNWVYFAHNWVSFAFLLLLGIKFMLESIEKSPSFTDLEVNDTGKMIRVSSIFGLNALLVGFVVETVGKAFFPQVIILGIVTFMMTLLGFHLGNPNSQTIASKKVELLAGIILLVIAIWQILV